MGKRKLLIKNGGMLLEELVASCNGKSNPIAVFTHREVRIGTDNYDFRHLLVWDGGYRLYQGFLQGRLVSIKRFEASFMGGPESVVADIVIGSSMSFHKNGLKLLGCCLETKNPIIVYEFIGDTVLAKCLNVDIPQEVLKWKQRLRIAMDICNAIAYLHTGFPRPIVHRDIKASSILLDQNGVARLIDFSLAIPIPHGGLQTSVEERTGFGGPEYMQTGYLTEKADVYLFGLLLLHLLAGYHVSRVTCVGDDEYAVYPGVTQFKEEKKKFIEIVDRKILEERVVVHEQLLGFWMLSLRCIDNVGEDRPTMVDVGKQLRLLYKSFPLPSP